MENWSIMNVGDSMFFYNIQNGGGGAISFCL